MPAGPTQAPVSKDVAVEIILDTSGSMLDKFGGKSRIDIAKQVLDGPGDRPAARRVRRSRCGCWAVAPIPAAPGVAVPFGPLDADDRDARWWTSSRSTRRPTRPSGRRSTPSRTDLAQATGARIVLLITDSKEIWPQQGPVRP